MREYLSVIKRSVLFRGIEEDEDIGDAEMSAGSYSFL